ncbi:MAG: alpha-amylase, partial [candidate division Zixibacteria bacterium]|nr:alpha-amylase [candidate division Zixibacteria bacterium]NIW39193.1 alpha-amylase [candidate division Zixibacteria bacterium]
TASGNVIFHNLHAARVFAQKMNQHRDLINHPEKAISAADLNAMGLIDEIMHYVILLYRMEINPEVLQNAQQCLEEKIGMEALNRSLHQFVKDFPPVEVYRNKTDVSTYLTSETEGMPNRLIALEEMLMLWLANRNEAFEPYNELFDETALKSKTEYSKSIDELHKFFGTQPPFGPEKQNLIDLLLTPGKKSPTSLRSQLL